MNAIELYASSLISTEEFRSLQHGASLQHDTWNGKLELGNGTNTSYAASGRNFGSVEAAVQFSKKAIEDLANSKHAKYIVLHKNWEAPVKIKNVDYVLYFSLHTDGTVNWLNNKWKGEVNYDKKNPKTGKSSYKVSKN